MADLVFGVIPQDRSGTIASGGTAQQLMAGKPGRRGFSIQNLSTGDLWIRAQGNPDATIVNAAASQPSLQLTAGTYYETPPFGCPMGPVSIYGATGGQAFTAAEW